MTQHEERWILEKYNGEKTDEFFTDMARLREGEPLAFIIGSIPFLDTTIYLDSRPLIPRVETEYWVAQAIENIKKANMTRPRILDLCAGSGCIGVAVAKAFPEATIHFAELDEHHHATIHTNIVANDIRATTEIYGGHLFAHTHGPYDVIMCNPPYIPNGSEHVQESVKKYEPALALYGGKDGTDLIQEIITESSAQLSPAGVLYIEHEPEQSEHIARFAHAHGFTAHAHTDQYDTIRYSTLHARDHTS